MWSGKLQRNGEYILKVPLVNKGEPLFPRIDVKKELEELEKLTLAAAENKEKQSPKQETEKKMQSSPRLRRCIKQGSRI